MEVIDKILTIDELPEYNNSIQREILLPIIPTTGSDLDENGIIDFVIETCNQYLLPSKSYLYLEIILTKEDDTKLKNEDITTLVNNAPMFLFSRARYSLGNKSIEEINDPGRASLMKGVLSYSTELSEQNTFGWILESDSSTETKIEKYTGLRDGKLAFYIPLSHIFGFAECYNKVIYGVSHSLTLQRGFNRNAIYSRVLRDLKIVISKIEWVIPKIEPNLEMEHNLMKMFKQDKIFSVPFLSRQLLDHIVHDSVSDFSWPLGARSEQILYFIIGFQTNKLNNYENTAIFDHLNLETIVVELDHVPYPLKCIRCNFRGYNAVQQYNFAKEFKHSYYKTTKEYPFINEDNYIRYYPLFVFDATRQGEKIKKSLADITIKATFSRAIPANTKCYCLILYDTIKAINNDGLKINVRKFD